MKRFLWFSVCGFALSLSAQLPSPKLYYPLDGSLVSLKNVIVWLSLRAIGPVKGPAAEASAAGMGR
jgi:hypothetical protein